MTSLAALATFALFLDVVVSQIDWPSCTTDTMTWSFNSLGQNSCGVAAYLQSTCSQGIFSIQPLPFGYEYGGPSGSDDGDLCKCNTVTYSLISACDACQGAPWISYSEWTFNCTTVLPPSSFPNAIPDGTFVPYWALLDVTLEDNWDMTESIAAGDSPEVPPGAFIGTTTTGPPTTFVPPPTVFPSFPPTTSIPTFTTPTASSLPVPALSSLPSPSHPTASNSPLPAGSSLPSSTIAASLSTKSSSHTAVIVGGSVGAVAIIAIVVLAVFYIRHRRNLETKPPYAPFSVTSLPASPTAPVTAECASPPLSGARNTRSEAQTIASSVRRDSAPMGVYNPNNAATLPEVQDPDAPHLSVQALFGQPQGSGNNNLAHMHVSRPEEFSSLSSA